MKHASISKNQLWNVSLLPVRPGHRGWQEPSHPPEPTPPGGASSGMPALLAVLEQEPAVTARAA